MTARALLLTHLHHATREIAGAPALTRFVHRDHFGLFTRVGS